MKKATFVKTDFGYFIKESPRISLHYSPDDEVESGAGWYFQDYDTWETSQLFISADRAKAMYAAGQVKWSK